MRTTTVNLSNGDSIQCRLVVRNVTGIAEERGYRLYWQNVDEPNSIVPALGVATSSPFRTERAARIIGKMMFGEFPVRIAP